MVRAGVDPELIGRTAAALVEREPVKIIDEPAERRRAKDRERKRLRKSAESADSAEPLAPFPDKEVSPVPLQEINPNPAPPSPKGVSPTPRSELETVLDADRAQAVIEHRQRVGKPLTAYGARRLALSLTKWHDPNEAADEMVERGWQGFRPEWMTERIQHRSGAPPPKRERTVSDVLQEIAAGTWQPPDRDDENSFSIRN